ncbi:MAG: hypothetical protein IPL84_02790 [Chitinophagaceae bacterium]|nr:hypothetical protein [Chitinophagaceae bacterium]
MKSHSDARIRLLAQEYRKSDIALLEENIDILSLFKDNQYGTRDFFHILSFAVISTYISVKLDKNIKDEINSFKKNESEYKEFTNEFPEIELLFLLNEKEKELPINQTKYIDFFEEFLVMDRTYRSNENIKRFLGFITDERSSLITNYSDIIDILIEENKYELLDTLLTHGSINEEAFQILYGFTELNDFMSNLRIFFRNYDEDLPIAFCWLFYGDLFDKLISYTDLMNQFYEIVINWSYDGLIIESAMNFNEKLKIEKEIAVYIKKSKETFYWLTAFGKSESKI